jgi:hypothetical protein
MDYHVTLTTDEHYDEFSLLPTPTKWYQKDWCKKALYHNTLIIIIVALLVTAFFIFKISGA